jgi:formylglycine-generating enzyme required for sulfatase activity
LVLIPAGSFLMGGDPEKDREAMRVEEPQHVLGLADYYMARTPVTNAQYEAFVLDSGHSPPTHWEKGKPPRGRGDHPVVRVSWHDATDYCRWLAEATGKPYRLPTEAEWEKAARGTEGSIYPWGDTWDAKRCNTKENGRGDTTPVGAYPLGASPYGLLDMAGNVWEWTTSLLWNYPYQADDGRQDPSSPDSRVLRGGSWLNLYDTARTTYRRSYVPAYHSRLHGFRCCMSAEDAP